MDLLNINQASKQDKNGILEAPFLGRGFRPFFLLGAAFALWSIAVWAAVFPGVMDAPAGMWDDMLLWHGHEMLFGFAAAIIAGFLLTAVPNWTGLPQVKGGGLLLLCLLWLAGRVAMHALPPSLVQAAIDLAFLPVLAGFLARSIIRAGSRRNYIFLLLLAVMTGCNVLMHMGGESVGGDSARGALYVVFMIVMIMISLIGGRVVPFFTVAAMRMQGIRLSETDQPKMDAAALVSLVAVTVMLAIAPSNPVWLAGASVFAVVVHLLRLRHWHVGHAFKVPMLWILHLGYLWLVLGLALVGVSAYLPQVFFPALHAMSVGAVGSMTIGMMCRVARGHTGRDIIAGRAEIAAFAMIQLAALLRVAGPLAVPDMHHVWISLSAVLWCVCYAIYLPVFIPVMFSPRPDGRPA